MNYDGLKLEEGTAMYRDYKDSPILPDEDTQADMYSYAAEMLERYGYKLVSMQKHTTQRDTILRLCLAARFDLDETDKALILYGMAPLHARLPRDAAFIVAIQNRVYDIHDVDAILRENDLPPFLT